MEIHAQGAWSEFKGFAILNQTCWPKNHTFAWLKFSKISDNQKISELNANIFAGVTGWHLAAETELKNLFDQVLSLTDAQKYHPTYVLHPFTEQKGCETCVTKPSQKFLSMSAKQPKGRVTPTFSFHLSLTSSTPNFLMLKYLSSALLIWNYIFGSGYYIGEYFSVKI